MRSYVFNMDILLFNLSDKLVSKMSEAAMLGDDDFDISEHNVQKECLSLLDLTLGKSREPGQFIWEAMQEYALSRGNDS